MTVSQIEQKYHGLQVVPCNVSSCAGETVMYLFLFPSAQHTSVEIKNILDNAIRDFVDDNSCHEYVSSYKDDIAIRIIITDFNVLIPARMVG